MKSCFGNNRQGRCACNTCMAVRWPLFCTRCGSTSHYAEDCKRMPAGMGKSQQERDFDAMVRADRAVILLAAVSVILALVLFGLLERVP
jgi:hypothetical protein